MSNQLINAEITKLTPSTLLDLFILDALSLGISNAEDSEGLFRFHAGTNGLFSNIIFDGFTYYAFPVEVEGFIYDGKGSLPRPTLRCANVNAYVSNLVMKGQNLVGGKIIRKRTFAKFLDNENFPNNLNPYGVPNPDAVMADEIYYINRKINENSLFVEFELVSQLEVDGVRIPRRKIIANCCAWKYRGDGCGYSGAPVSDSAKKKFEEDYGLTLVDQGAWNNSANYSPGHYVYVTSRLETNLNEKFYYVCIEANTNEHPRASSKWMGDICDRTLSRCRMTWGSGPLPYGGFPSLMRLPY